MKVEAQICLKSKICAGNLAEVRCEVMTDEYMDRFDSSRELNNSSFSMVYYMFMKMHISFVFIRFLNISLIHISLIHSWPTQAKPVHCK